MSKNSAFQLSGQAVLGNATNPLLVKDDVGKAKPFTHSLPRGDFAYGRINRFSESAGEGKCARCQIRSNYFFVTAPAVCNLLVPLWLFHNSDREVPVPR